jgi:glycosyltransferase involved in cell wall biosynthesis
MGIKVVSQIHGGPLPAEFFANNAFLTWMLRQVFKASDAISVLSKREYDAYSAFAPKTLIAHIPNAIEPPLFLKEISATESDRVRRPLRLVYIGRLVREKGLFEALEAISKPQRAGRCLQFDVAGGGRAEAELRTRAAELGLNDVVHFHGPVRGVKKSQLWSEADLLIFPSYSEGLPYALLEAMAAGTPAITCAVGAIPDVMQDGVQGIFVPPRDVQAIAQAIATLDDDRILLIRMASASRARVLENYTVNRLAKDFGDLYSAILKHS